MSSGVRTCIKCRLHGKYSQLRGHKKSCPYLYCICKECSSHDKLKELKDGRKVSDTSANKSTGTSTRAVSVDNIPFPEKPQSQIFVQQLANVETQYRAARKSQTPGERRKGNAILYYSMVKSIRKD